MSISEGYMAKRRSVMIIKEKTRKGINLSTHGVDKLLYIGKLLVIIAVIFVENVKKRKGRQTDGQTKMDRETDKQTNRPSYCHTESEKGKRKSEPNRF